MKHRDTEGWRERYLEALAQLKIQTHAAAAVGVSETQVIKARKRNAAFDMQCRQLMDKRLAKKRYWRPGEERPQLAQASAEPEAPPERWHILGAVGYPRFSHIDLVLSATSAEEAREMVERSLAADLGQRPQWCAGPKVEALR